MPVLLAAALLASAASAQTPSVGDDNTILVTGVRLSDARARLDQCLARHCPTLEDIAATLHYAEALFVDGQYERAGAILSRSIDRNRADAAHHPVALAGLYRAHARISIHFGDGDAFRRSTYGAVRALRAGFAEDDPHVLGARLEAAEMHARLGEAGEASRLYRAVAERAGAIGRPDIAALADMRRGWMLHVQGQAAGRALIEEVAGRDDPRVRIQRFAARILLARIARAAGDVSLSERLVAEIAAVGFGQPTLVYAPPIEVADGGQVPRRERTLGQPAVVNVDNMGGAESFDYWADVGFWVRPDGSVEDVEVLRAHGPDFWQAPVLRSVAGRQYTPAGGTRAGEPSYRVERFSYTSLLERRTDSRILARSARGRIESLDLTPRPGEAAAQPRPATGDPL